MDKKSIWKSYRFPIILIIGIVVGALLGVGLGEKATVLKPLGDIFLNLMFTIVVPMVYVSITTAVGNMAVSYTHLDQNSVDVLRVDGKDDLDPVSYTHLVLQRPGLRRWGAGASGALPVL